MYLSGHPPVCTGTAVWAHKNVGSLEEKGDPGQTRVRLSVLAYRPYQQLLLRGSCKNPLLWGAWVAQSVKRPTSAWVVISRFVGSSPTSGYVLTARSLEPASDSVSPLLSAPPLLVLCLSLSLKNKYMFKKKERSSGGGKNEEISLINFTLTDSILGSWGSASFLCASVSPS